MAFCLEVWRDFFLKIQVFLGFIPMLHREIAFSLKLTPQVAADRVAHRPGHFMPKTLIDSQFDALESPSQEPLVLTLNAGALNIDELAHRSCDWWSEHSLLATS